MGAPTEAAAAARGRGVIEVRTEANHMPTSTLVATFTIALAVAATAQPAHACNCGRLPPAAVMLRASDAVFVGKAVRNRLSFTHLFSETVTTFEVSRAWKGVDGRVVSVSSDGTRLPIIGGETSCESAGFPKDSVFLVFAFEDEGRLATGVCLGTLLVPGKDSEERHYVDSVIRALGPDVPIPATDTRQGAPSDDWVWLTAGATALAIWARRRWRRRPGAPLG